MEPMLSTRQWILRGLALCIIPGTALPQFFVDAGMVRLKNLFRLILERRYPMHEHLPNLVVSNGEIAVSQTVAQASDSMPWHVLKAVTRVSAQLGSGFTNHKQVSKDGTAERGVSIQVTSGAGLNCHAHGVRRFDNVHQVQSVTPVRHKRFPRWPGPRPESPISGCSLG